MKRGSFIVLLLLVLAPLAVLAWAGVRLARHEQMAAQRQIEAALQGRLDDIAAQIEVLMDERRRQLMTALTEADPSPAGARKLTRTNPHVTQTFVLAPSGQIVHPNPADPHLSDAEWTFLRRAQDVLSPGELLAAQSEQPTQQQSQSQQHVPLEPLSGWHSWFWGRGAHVLLWRRDEAGRFTGVELNGARLLADVIALLPDSTPQGEKRVNLSRGLNDAASIPRDGLQPELLRLVDSAGATLYQWAPRGLAEWTEGGKPVVSRPLAPPLHAWSLEMHLPAGSTGAALGRGTMISLFLGFAALALALGGLAIYLWREQTRAMREAAQRITFVNQVSHELKTPLTNIRLYAEMMDGDIGAEPGDPRRRQLDVILSESQRLSRLIGNILSFAKGRRNSLTLNPAPGVIDKTVEQTAERFRPALDVQNITLALQLNAPERVEIDADALEQILGNLLNNVEKYAPDTTVTVATRRDAAAGRTIITVADTGPGIAARHRDKIFAPFYRATSRLTDGVAGTGIGLSIARDLARLHGGDIQLMDSDGGATFEVSIKAADV